MDNLKPVTELRPDLPKINEFQFKTSFLYRFLSRDESEVLAAREEWINEIAMTPLVRVEVVSDTNHDEVLFWVPQMVYTPKTYVTNEISKIVSEAIKLEETVSKEVGQAVLDKNLGQSKVFTPEPPPQEDKDQWAAILKRYGLVTNGGTLDKQSKKRTVTDEVEETYDL